MSEVGKRDRAWTTDIEGDVCYGITRDDLENLGLPYHYSDGEWMPLTEKEFSYLQPDRYLPLRPGPIHRNEMWTPDINGLEVKVGQSCVWKGKKWLVPSIEFSFGEDEKATAFAELESYVRDLRPLIDPLGGEIEVHADATDYAHEIEIFIPMELALDFDTPGEWAVALTWLLCPADKRDRLTRVMATFNTPTTSPGYEVTWDATFDVLREGRTNALNYIMGERDDDLNLRYCESPFAHKDAQALWNESWDIDLDMRAMVGLFGFPERSS